MLNEKEAQKRIQLALDNALDYIKNEQNFVFNREKIEECLRKRSEHLGLNQKIYWLNGLNKKSFNSLDSSLRSSVESSLRSSYGFIWWDSEYLAANDKELKEYSKFIKEAIQNGLGFVCDFEKAIIAIPMPKFRKDNQRRLHSEFQEAVRWHDGYEEYYLWGVKLEKDLWQKIVDKTLSFKEIMELKNIEQRMVALKMMDTEKLLKESNA